MFPVPDGTNGYWLLGGGVYRYKLDYPTTDNQDYIGSSGIWKVNANGVIEIHKEREFFLKEGNVSCTLVDNDWHIIGNSIAYQPYNPDTGSPATLVLTNDKLIEKKTYYMIDDKPSNMEQQSILNWTTMSCI